jgi:adhesin transport system membrane fusion protein
MTAVRGFEIEADELLSRARTRSARAIVHVALVVVALLLGWAALAQVDEVTRGDG